MNHRLTSCFGLLDLTWFRWMTSAFGLLLVSCVSCAAHAADVSRELQLFLERYQCALANQLRLIHDDTAREKDRFLILSLADSPQSYVQCLFVEQDRKILCEASSGRLGPPAGSPHYLRVFGQRLHALTRLGFDTSAADGNYQLLIGPPESNDLNSVAALILTALHQGYGAMTRSRLLIRAPLGDLDELFPAECAPMG